MAGATSSRQQGRIGLHILGTGRYLPRRRVASDEIDRRLGWSAGRTQARYGLAARHVAQEPETSSMMAEMAARQALDRAGLEPGDLDLILGGCGVMEQAIPSTATLVQARLGLGASGIASYDVNATCLGFVQALDLAALKIAAGQARRVLVFAADIASVGLDWDQPDTAAIFGDGAAAVVLAPDDGTDPARGILASRFATWGDARDACVLAGGGTRITAAVDPQAAARASYFRMDGQAAFRAAARHLPRFLRHLLEDAGIGPDDLDCIIPHQASGPALEHGLARLGLPTERVVMTFPRYGNQIAASIPTALDDAICAGRLQRGQLALILGTSAGVSIGGMVLRY